MKSSIKKKTYKAIYRLLNHVSPLPTDCGQLCETSFCCTPTGEDYGIYLLPGEDKLFTKSEPWLSWSSELAEDYEFPDSWTGKVFFIRCNTPPICHRTMRPLQCRFFPITPHILDDERLILILSTINVSYTCPLIDEQIPLSLSFLKASHTVWNKLITDPLIYDLVKMDSLSRDFFIPVYPKL